MSLYEYRVIPAPRKGKSGKGVRGGPAKFAHAVSDTINSMSMEGWQYLRADTLPCEERQGLTGKTVNDHALLVFRRPLDAMQEQPIYEEQPTYVEAPEVAEHHQDWETDEPETMVDEAEAPVRRPLFANR